MCKYYFLKVVSYRTNILFFLKYFFDDPTIRMLKYTHLSDGKKIIKENSDLTGLTF